MKKTLFIILILPFFLNAQEEKNDTLFIKYDKKLLSRERDPETKEFYYLIKDSQIESGYIYFLEKKIYKKNELKTNSKKHCLRKIIKKAGAFSDTDKNDIYDHRLYMYFSNEGYHKKYFLVKGGEFIEVDIVYAID